MPRQAGTSEGTIYYDKNSCDFNQGIQYDNY